MKSKTPPVCKLQNTGVSRNNLVKRSTTYDLISSSDLSSGCNSSGPDKTPYDFVLEQIQLRWDSKNSSPVPSGLAPFESNSNVGRYTLHEVLGKGSFSKVQLATHQLTKGNSTELFHEITTECLLNTNLMYI
nr:hypothetical protein HmN_000767100 [Hymenolepis microstoma]